MSRFRTACLAVLACASPALTLAQTATPSELTTALRFVLPAPATTSAGVYATDGRLVRTLWRAEAHPAGALERSWDGRDDHAAPVSPGRYEVRLLHHRLSHVWEGVIGNSSATLGEPQAHKAYLPPASIAIRGDTAYYAVGYNEQQPGIHGFRLATPQHNTRPVPSTDAFAAVSMLATDTTRLYWANTGGLVRTSFISAFDLAGARPAAFAAGRSVCLNKRPNSNTCYEGHLHPSVIDLNDDVTEAPTGLAVQNRGRVLAVAHGGKNLIRLFDKTSGEALGTISVPLNANTLNQIAMTATGDLWAISGNKVLRYTDLETRPRLTTTLGGLSQPVAVASHPVDDQTVWVADAGSSQQLKRFDGSGPPAAVIGQAGGYLNDPVVQPDKLCFRGRDGREQSAIAVALDNSLWVIDTCNNRMLRFRTDVASPKSDGQVAYLPAFYTSTVDHTNPRRVFANFLEFDADTGSPWRPGRSWRLVRNWLPSLPAALADRRAFNGLFGGFVSVETLSNGRTYGVVSTRSDQAIVELVPSGPLRVVGLLGRALPGATLKVMYENGDLGYALTGREVQIVMRLPLTGFTQATGDPVWASEPVALASVPTRPGTPYYRGAFSGMPPRFPVTASGKVVFFDPSVVGNEGFHLGAAALGGTGWLWQASPSGWLDGKGSFQTKANDGSTHYGGNSVWAHGRHIVYGYHGEFHKDPQTGRIGQANQFMHFDESGLFLAQFGQPSTRSGPPSQAGMSGNAFSPTLVRIGEGLYLYHNDESSHGGVHRWRIDGWNEVRELRGTGNAGGTIELR